MLGYTLYRNVIPYPPSGPGRWFPVVAGIWLVVALVTVFVAPGSAGARGGAGRPGGHRRAAVGRGRAAAAATCARRASCRCLSDRAAPGRRGAAAGRPPLPRGAPPRPGRPALEAMLTEADYPGVPGVTMFGSQLGLALRRWCPPVLGLAAHAEPGRIRGRAGHAGVGGDQPAGSCGPPGWPRCTWTPGSSRRTADRPGRARRPGRWRRAAREIVRLEQVAEAVGGSR